GPLRFARVGQIAGQGANLDRRFWSEPKSACTRRLFADERRLGRCELETELAKIAEARQPELHEALEATAAICWRADEQALEMCILVERHAANDVRLRKKAQVAREGRRRRALFV